MKTYRAMGLDHTPKRGRVGSPKQRFGAPGAGGYPREFGIYAIATAGPAARKARLAFAGKRALALLGLGAAGGPLVRPAEWSRPASDAPRGSTARGSSQRKRRPAPPWSWLARCRRCARS